MTIILIISLIALVIAIDALRRTVTAWNAVLDKRANASDILHLTGFNSERDVHWKFAAHKNNDAYQIEAGEIFRQQTRIGRVFSDPLLDMMIAALMVVAIMSHYLPLMLSATAFVMLWHVFGRQTAHAIENDEYQNPFDE